MKVLVTGVGGQLGYDVSKALIARGHIVVGSDIIQVAPSAFAKLIEGLEEHSYVPLDITDDEVVKSTTVSLQPDVIIHCAAWTAVDEAEKPENYGKVQNINGEGTARIAMAARNIGAKLVYISTDYVFDGSGEEPWKPDDPRYKPLNVYGKSKLSGEYGVAIAVKNFFIVRIAWVFGKNGNNFVKTMLKLGKQIANGEREGALRVVNDQIGTPTYTPDLARLLVDMIETDKYGYYHVTNDEVEPGAYISWNDYACAIFEEATKRWPEVGFERVVVEPVSTEEYGLSLATRPMNSRLDKTKLDRVGFERLPNWHDALVRYLKEIELEDF